MSRMKFGEVAREVRETWAGDTAGVPVVGLEHFDPDEPALARWGTAADGTFTKRFRKGQVLLGRRRAYQRKAAVAPFDGICSGDITVIEALPGRILPGLLPFLVQNPSFFDHAVRGSAGSLSPRVKWDFLATYEFDLPDLSVQRGLVEKFRALFAAKEAYRKLLSATDELVKSQFVEMFGDPVENPNGWKVKRLGDVCTKITDGTHKTPHYQPTGIPFISAKNIVDGNLDFSDVKFITCSEYQEIQRRCNLEPGDILLSKSGTLGNPAILEQSDPIGIFESLAVLKYHKESLSSRFLYEQLLQPFVQAQFQDKKRGIAVPHLHLNVISDVRIILPPRDLQDRFAAFVAAADKSKFAARQSLERLDAVYRALSKETFG